VRGTTTIGIVSGFAALFTSTLGGSALACTHPSAGSTAVFSAAAPSISDIRSDLQPAKEAARLGAYAKFAHEAMAFLQAKAAGLAGDLSTVSGKGAPAKLVDRASSARSAAVTDLADAKQSLAGADAALAEGDNASAARQLRVTASRLHAAAARLAATRLLLGAAMHTVLLAAKSARLAKIEAARADDVTFADTDAFAANEAFDGRHHCDGFGDARWGDHDGWHHDRYKHDGYHHDGYHHDWQR
jgi:hypothetical protein